MYNLTNLTSAENLYEVSLAANQFTSGLLFTGFVIVAFVAFVVVLKRYEFSNSLLAASFVFFFLTMLLSFIGLISSLFTLIFAILVALSAFYVFVKGNSGSG